MKISINGEAREISTDNLHSALEELGYGDAMVATAVNGAFVGQPERAHTTLKANDKVEILAPMQGG